ncbi:hypothetical protein [Haloglomus litoreum]|uniref:hypothetical protein n=1 Tax=Haloglomus litoreum TaxID=3034026 RepID=UPI0023E8B126|nr:hypothetical protein [Haloglomus sp. DT116]
MATSVTWRHDATTERWLRGLYLVGAALLHGVFGLAAAALLAVVGLALLTGNTAVRLLVVVLVLVGGPASVLYLLPMLRDPDQRPRFYPEEMTVGLALSLRQRVALGLLGAAALAGPWLLDPRLTGLVAVGGVLAGVTYAVATTRGTIDPERAVLDAGARVFDLDRVTGYRVRPLGPLTLVTLSIPARPGRLGRSTTRLLVPTDRLDDVTAALDAIVAEAAPETGRDPNPQVQLAAGALALLFLGIGAAAVATIGAGVGWYVAALCGLFGLLLLLVAREG